MFFPPMGQSTGITIPVQKTLIRLKRLSPWGRPERLKPRLNASEFRKQGLEQFSLTILSNIFADEFT